MINPELLNAHAHEAKHVISFQRWEIIGTHAIDQDHWSFYLYLSQCHLLYDLHSLQNVIHRRNRETTGRPIPRTPSWHRERQQKHRVGRQFNLPNHSKQHMAVSSLSLHQGSTESCRTLEQKFTFQICTLDPYGINESFLSANLFCCLSRYQAPTNIVAPSFCV